MCESENSLLSSTNATLRFPPTLSSSHPPKKASSCGRRPRKSDLPLMYRSGPSGFLLCGNHDCNKRFKDGDRRSNFSTKGAFQRHCVTCGKDTRVLCSNCSMKVLRRNLIRHQRRTICLQRKQLIASGNFPFDVASSDNDDDDGEDENHHYSSISSNDYDEDDENNEDEVRQLGIQQKSGLKKHEASYQPPQQQQQQQQQPIHHRRRKQPPPPQQQSIHCQQYTSDSTIKSYSLHPILPHLAPLSTPLSHQSLYGPGWENTRFTTPTLSDGYRGESPQHNSTLTKVQQQQQPPIISRVGMKRQSRLCPPKHLPPSPPSIILAGGCSSPSSSSPNHPSSFVTDHDHYYSPRDVSYLSAGPNGFPPPKRQRMHSTSAGKTTLNSLCTVASFDRLSNCQKSVNHPYQHSQQSGDLRVNEKLENEEDQDDLVEFYHQENSEAFVSDHPAANLHKPLGHYYCVEDGGDDGSGYYEDTGISSADFSADQSEERENANEEGEALSSRQMQSSRGPTHFFESAKAQSGFAHSKRSPVDPDFLSNKQKQTRITDDDEEEEEEEHDDEEGEGDDFSDICSALCSLKDQPSPLSSNPSSPPAHSPSNIYHQPLLHSIPLPSVSSALSMSGSGPLSSSIPDSSSASTGSAAMPRKYVAILPSQNSSPTTSQHSLPWLLQNRRLTLPFMADSLCSPSVSSSPNSRLAIPNLATTNLFQPSNLFLPS